MEFTGIDDIEYLRNKMMAALKIPKSFLGYEEDLSGKATLAAEDVRFAKTIVRVQKFIVSELTKIAVIHLYSQGYKDAELADFSLELTNPSTISEKEQVSVWQEKINLAADMMESKLISRTWIYSNLFHMSDDDMKVIANDIIEDTKQAFRHKQIEEEGIDPAKAFNKVKSGDDGGNNGGDLPPDDGSPGNDNIPGDKNNNEPRNDTKPQGNTPSNDNSKGIAEKIRDQTGRKDARKYPFGEDPLGSGENIRKANKTTRNYPISHKYANNSPLSLESSNDIKKVRKLLSEGSIFESNKIEKKTYLDESNILE
jgi:hypothetical protein